MTSETDGGREITPEPIQPESQESGRETSDARDSSEESKQVHEATVEPEAVVELRGDYEQSEAVEVAFVEAVDISLAGSGETREPVDDPSTSSIRETDYTGATGESVQETTEEIQVATRDATIEPESREITMEAEATREAGEESSREGSSEGEDVEVQVVVQALTDEEQLEEEEDTDVLEAVLVTEVEFTEEEEDGIESIVASQTEQGIVVDTEELFVEGEEDGIESIVASQTEQGIVVDTEGLFVEGELEEIWTPPEMYMHVASDGTRTIVDASGNALDSPPLYQVVVDSTGVEKILATYPTGTGDAYKFELGFYSPPMEGLKAYYGHGGTIEVVDEKGNLLESPPVITKVVDSSGMEQIFAKYPGTGTTQPVKLEAYSAPIDSDMVFAYKSQDGTIQIVDATGKLLQVPPTITGYADYLYGDKFPVVNYLGTGGQELGEGTMLSWYKASLEGMFVHAGQDGSYTVVDSSGKQVESPPVINKVVDSSGVEIITASYQGIRDQYITGELQYYSASLEGMFIYHGPNNSISVVDQNGKSIESPPNIMKVVGDKGNVLYMASYPSGGEASKAILTSYQAAITDMYVHVGQGGNITIVDGDGKPIESPPMIQKVVENGMEIIRAYYPGDPTESKPVTLSYYVPPSST